MSKRLPNGIVLAKVMEYTTRKNHTLLDIEYLGSKSILKLKCNKDDYVWTSLYNTYVNCDRGCSKCSGNLYLSDDVVLANITKRNLETKYEIKIIEYKGSQTIIKLKCNIDNYVWTSNYHNFVNGKSGCDKCGKSYTLTYDDILDRINERNLETNYTTLNFNYNKSESTVLLKCTCDYEWTATYNHYYNKKTGCPKCGGSLKLTKYEIDNNINERNLETGYSTLNINYAGSDTVIKLKCNVDNHEWFAIYFNYVQAKKGCPICNSSKLELRIVKLLSENNIKFEREYSFKELNRQSLDFYLPDYNIAIECQGIQHFEAVEYFGGNVGFLKTCERDSRKYDICKSNDITLLYFSNILVENYLSYIFTDELELINYICELNNKI